MVRKIIPLLSKRSINTYSGTSKLMIKSSSLKLDSRSNPYSFVLGNPSIRYRCAFNDFKVFKSKLTVSSGGTI